MLLPRLRYALYLAIVLSVAASLVIMLGSGDSIAILPPSAFDFALSPGLFLVAYFVSFIATPFVAERFPIKRDWQVVLRPYPSALHLRVRSSSTRLPHPSIGVPPPASWQGVKT